MKRSEINSIMRSADEFIRQKGFYLPPFAYWSPEEWKTKGEEVREIGDHLLGWDITDYGRNNFSQLGLFLFTIRNGSLDNLKKMQGKIYCEKLLISEEGQITPFHFHWNKTEDIINRGGAGLGIQLYNSTKDGKFDDTKITVSLDGVEYQFNSGEKIELKPGESITLPPYLYHSFWGVGGKVMIGEVSVVNDDLNDNRFYEQLGRFPEIDEDEAPLYLLVGDYRTYYRPNK